MNENNPRYNGHESLTDPRWVGVDLDDTLVEGVFPRKGIGQLLPGARQGLERLVALGFKPVLYTARSWGDTAAVENWITDNGLPIKRILLGKPLFRMYIGDEAFRLTDWQADLPQIETILERPR